MSFLLVLNQVLILFLLIALGFLVARGGLLSAGTLDELTRFMMLIVSPCVILSSLQVSYTPALARGLCISAACAVGVHVASIAAAHALFRKGEAVRRAVLQFASIYSNCGFMGLPLLKALVGGNGLFYGAVYIAVFNLFSWTHGIALYQRAAGVEQGGGLRTFLRAMLNPNMFAVAIGVALFLCSVRLPSQLLTPVSLVADVNTPFSMVIIGGLMSKMDLRLLFNDRGIWPGVLMRNVLMPLAALVVMRLLHVDAGIARACLIQAACPAAGFTVMYAELFGEDTAFASKLMSVSTLVSIATVPLLLMVFAL